MESSGGGGWNDVVEQPAASSSNRRETTPPALGLPPRPPHRRGNSFDRAQQEPNNDFQASDQQLWRPPPSSPWHAEDPPSLQPLSPLSAMRNSSATRPYHSDDAEQPQLRTSLSSIPYVSSPVAQLATPLAVSFIDHDQPGGGSRQPNAQRFGVSHSRTSTGGGEYPQSPGGRSNRGASVPSAFAPGDGATSNRLALMESTTRAWPSTGEYPRSPGLRSNPSGFTNADPNRSSSSIHVVHSRTSTGGGDPQSPAGQRSNYGDDAPTDAFPAYTPQSSQAVPLRSLDGTLASMPSMNLMRPKSSASLLSRSTRTHWEVPQPSPADASPLSQPAQPSEQQAQELAQLRKVMRDKSEEIMRLRASLIIALQCYSYAPSGNGDVSHAERQFLSAVSNAVAADSETAAPVLLVDQAPSHVQGVPTMPLPLDINSVFGQFYGFLQMLETEEKTIFKKSWKPRFVVADQHGIAVFREENDFKLHAFHKAILYVPYHDLEFFVPSFRDATIPEMLQRATETEDASVAALTQMTLVAQQHAADARNAYFGFISKQTPHSSQKNSNPQIVFRSSSFQEHADWVHFLAKCFNMRLYRDMFPMMLAETMFGLICKQSQTEPPPIEHLETQTEDVVFQEEDPALMFSPPPPPPPGAAPTDGGALTAQDAGEGDVAEGIDFGDPVERFRDAGTDANVIAVRAEACQTDDLPQWVSSIATASSELLDSESVILQHHMFALEEQCKQLRQENVALKLERDEAIDYAANVQASLAVAERETKRLRQMVVDEHQSALDMIADAQREDLEAAKAKQDTLFQVEQANAELQKKVLALTAEIDQLNEALVVSRRESVEHIQALAHKAVTDIDALHSEMLKADVQSSTIFSPPRTMLLEGYTSAQEEMVAQESEHSRLGSLELFCNDLGDVQFNLVLDQKLCHIASTHEIREQLRKTWRLRSSLTDGEVEISATLRWDEDEDEDNASTTSDQSSVGLPAEDMLTPRNIRKGYSNARNIKDESTQGMLERLQRVTPAALVGRVALQKKPFVPYV